jgi:hypothetical protein
MNRPHVVYRLFNADGELLYVGMTCDVEQRFTYHRAVKPWWPDVANQTFEQFPDRESAEQAEVAAIRSEVPRHNITHSTVNRPVHTPRVIPGGDKPWFEMATETLTSVQCAEAWGVKPATWRHYVAKGYAPEPLPGFDEQRLRRWDAATVRDWPRAGQGARTDRRKPAVDRHF